MSHPKLLVYEVNEVPWRVVDDYVRAFPKSHWARLVEASASFTTLTPDKGELSPWITWPTMHRGVPNNEHGIAFLGQDPSTFRYDPVWKILKDAKFSIGIFGSLQSWPVPVLGLGDFYVPDTFAQDATCHPPELAMFQQFNLENVRENGRVVRSRPGIRTAVGSGLRLWTLGLRASTLLSAGGQVLREVMDRRFAHRRPVFQGKIAFDLFLRAWRRTKPDFATFFTNHVAGLQHRYWQAKYPADYQADDVQLDPFFRTAIDYAMAVSDAQLGRLMNLADTENVVVVVASSMGQEAIHRPPDAGELQLRHVDRLAANLGLPATFTENLAMAPQVALSFKDPHDLDMFGRALEAFTDLQGRPIFRTSSSSRSLSITVASTPEVVQEGKVRRRGAAGAQTIEIADLGLEVIHPDSPGTAYHSPEGILLFYGPGVRPVRERTTVSTLDFLPTVLDFFGVRKPAYLHGSSVLQRLGLQPGVAGPTDPEPKTRR